MLPFLDGPRNIFDDDRAGALRSDLGEAKDRRQKGHTGEASICQFRIQSWKESDEEFLSELRKPFGRHGFVHRLLERMVAFRDGGVGGAPSREPKPVRLSVVGDLESDLE